jgi:hypothetical protein
LFVKQPEPNPGSASDGFAVDGPTAPWDNADALDDDRLCAELRRRTSYEVTARLGAGGMGVVYLAMHGKLKRPAAIKILPPDCGRDSGDMAVEVRCLRLSDKRGGGVKTARSQSCNPVRRAVPLGDERRHATAASH